MNKELDANKSRTKTFNKKINKDPLCQLIKDIDNYPLLTQEETTKTFEIYQLGNEDERKKAKDKLINSNMRLVMSIVFREYSNYSCVKRGQVDSMDLIMEGTIGLMRAIEKFDLSKNCCFSTYATWWIHQSVSRAIYDQSRTIRIPVYMYDIMGKYLIAKKDIQLENNKPATRKEIAQRIGVTENKVMEIELFTNDIISLESPIGEDQDSYLIDFIEDEDIIKSDQYVDYKSLQNNLNGILDELSEKQSDILKKRFGLIDGNPMTLEQIGDEYGVTRERIRQIESKALASLRKNGKAKRIKEFYPAANDRIEKENNRKKKESINKGIEKIIDATDPLGYPYFDNNAKECLRNLYGVYRKEPMSICEASKKYNVSIETILFMQKRFNEIREEIKKEDQLQKNNRTRKR